VTPYEKLKVLCDAFNQENSSELRLLIHEIITSTTYLIDNVLPILKKIPELEPTTIADSELHLKVANYELNKFSLHLKSLELLRDTPKEIILIDDDVSQKKFYQERCDQRGIQFSFYESLPSFLESKTTHSKDALILVDWYLGRETTGDQVAMELRKHEFKNIYIVSSLEVETSPYRDYILGSFPKHPSWI
jgi:hypothetical protein